MPPQIAGNASVDPSALQSNGAGPGAPTNGAAPDQVRAKIEQAVTQIRDLSTQLDAISKGIPGSEKLITNIKTQLRQVAQLAAAAGAQQNGSADALPS